MVRKNKLPSKFQIKDLVSIEMGLILIPNCRILKVHFSEKKVLYDVEIMYETGQVTRMYNVDSVFVVERKTTKHLENINQVYGIFETLKQWKSLRDSIGICVGSDFIYFENLISKMRSEDISRRLLEEQNIYDLVSVIHTHIDKNATWDIPIGSFKF